MLNRTITTLVIALAAASGAYAQSTPAKKELVARILKAQQPGIQAMARNLVEQPAAELLASAGNALPMRVAKDKQEAVGKEIQADVQKFVDESAPAVQARAVALAPSTVGAMLEEKFSEEELKQIAAVFESPAYAKFQRMGEEMQKSLIEKLVAETRPTIEPRVRTLEQTIGKRLGVPPSNGAPATAPAAPTARTPARPASR